ncbi:hypothetical protein [Geobacillus sp. LYN3]|uniref:hypothetical protein n=1 Tax=Geobacillus sp. LYN3 TaxID=2169582 RepID=UPI001304D2AF|nr:hypothetical protein [Geobacillus sp. LYN3]
MAVAAATGPKRREPMASGARQSEKRRTLGARQRKSGSRLCKTASSKRTVI